MFFPVLQVSSSVSSNSFSFLLFQSSFPHSLGSLHLNLSSVSLLFLFLNFCPFFLPFHFFFFFLTLLFPSYPNYTIVMISSIFLDISLLFSCCCFSFLFFSSISDPAFSFLLFSLLCLFLHILHHFCCFNFNSVFLIL